MPAHRLLRIGSGNGPIRQPSHGNSRRARDIHGQVGIEIRLNRDFNLEIAGTAGERYEIQEHSGFDGATPWRTLTTVDLTNSVQTVPLPDRPASAPWFVRAAQVPRDLR